MSPQLVRWEIVWIERYDEVRVACFSTHTERFVARIGRNGTPRYIGRFFRLGSNQIDHRTNETGTHSTARKNCLVFIYDVFVDKPDERAVLDPIP